MEGGGAGGLVRLYVFESECSGSESSVILHKITTLSLRTALMQATVIKAGGLIGFGGGRGGRGSQYHWSAQSNVIQPSSFSKRSTWENERDSGFGSSSGFGHQDDGRKNFSNTSASSFGFSQNRFSLLSNQNDDVSDQDEIGKIIETIRKDIEIWESSRQWWFSAYSVVKERPCISGFSDLSPEELRLAYYNSRTEGNLQNYINSVQQLVNQWKNRIHELKNPSLTTKSSLIAELKNPSAQIKPPVGFGGQQTSSFGSSGFGTNDGSSSTFSFKASSGFGTSDPAGTSGFGSSSLAQNLPPFGSGSSSGGAVSFSFQSTASTTAAPAGFGNLATSTFGATSASGFESASLFGKTSASSGFGSSSSAPAQSSLFGGSSSAAAASVSTPSLFGNSTGPSASVFGSNETSAVSGSAVTTSSSGSKADKMFTLRAELSVEELKEFEAKRFTLGRVPLKPPPIELLTI
nr:PREDICTED: nucleoporin-like protein 2 isoform X2 [Latimeria chalumnae]|eukprot:XP_005997156.1 PREDICTED: nucleoporin-like protein 2 isoform X2 [Latimeria chalumnae]